MQEDISKARILRTIFATLFWIYIAIVFRITVFRHGFDVHHFMQGGTVNLTVMKEYFTLLKGGEWIRFIYLFVGNIIWFVPFGFYLKCIRQIKRIWLIVAAGLVFSLVVESMQYLWGTGISEIDDLILNTFGTFIGAMLGKVKVFQGFYRYNL